jgi:2-polyprenyl-6-methoxyphenol hydroxylase-like FAD-dependent oxidoreductase
MDGGLHLTFERTDFLGVFPLAGHGRARLIGTIRGDASAEPRWEDVSHTALEHLRIDVARVNWFSTYHVHHRVANAFRVGRAFLLGDAAHVHSPVGAQGMNTGIGDACNLAWKLAAVVRGARSRAASSRRRIACSRSRAARAGSPRSRARTCCRA